MDSSVNVTKSISLRRAKFRSQVLVVLEEVKNGYDDVSTFSPIEEVGNLHLSEWIQIAGAAALGGNPDDGILVYLSIKGVDSVKQKAIYEGFGYSVSEGNPDAYEKWYQMSEIHLLVEELDQIVYSIAGDEKFGRFASPDEHKRVQSERAIASKRQQKNYSIIGYLIAFFIFAIGLVIILLTTEF